MLTIVAFLVALGLLIAVHEYGHYRVAVACGVKVLRFSIGFGTTLFRWQPKNQKHGQSTEFVIGAFPVGGYVKMLDEREAPVPPEERHLAFNTQPLRSRAAIVAAGPIANLLLAALLYSAVSWYGMEEPKAVLGSPVAGSIAERAGLQGGELVQRAGFAKDTLEPVRSFESLNWLLTRGALDGRDVRLELAAPDGGPAARRCAAAQPAGYERGRCTAAAQGRPGGAVDPSRDGRRDGRWCGGKIRPAQRRRGRRGRRDPHL